jgi:hypothetical protein
MPRNRHHKFCCHPCSAAAKARGDYDPEYYDRFHHETKGWVCPICGKAIGRYHRDFVDHLRFEENVRYDNGELVEIPLPGSDEKLLGVAADLELSGSFTGKLKKEISVNGRTYQVITLL